MDRIDHGLRNLKGNIELESCDVRNSSLQRLDMEDNWSARRVNPVARSDMNVLLDDDVLVHLGP